MLSHCNKQEIKNTVFFRFLYSLNVEYNWYLTAWVLCATMTRSGIAQRTHTVKYTCLYFFKIFLCSSDSPSYRLAQEKNPKKPLQQRDSRIF